MEVSWTGNCIGFRPVPSHSSLSASYALLGTDVAYGTLSGTGVAMGYLLTSGAARSVLFATRTLLYLKAETTTDGSSDMQLCTARIMRKNSYQPRSTSIHAQVLTSAYGGTRSGMSETAAFRAEKCDGWR
eukprot:2208425-Rhodomonas_salina.1